MVTPRRRSRRVQKAEEIKRNTALKSPIKSPMKSPVKKVTGKRKMKKKPEVESKSLPRIRLKSLVGRKRKIRAGIHQPPGPRTDRSVLVRDFRNFVGPGPSWSLISQFFGPGPWIPRSEKMIQLKMSIRKDQKGNHQTLENRDCRRKLKKRKFFQKDILK